MLSVYNQAKLSFVFVVAIGIAIISVIGFLLFRSYSFLPAIFGFVDSVCGCVSYLTFGSNPYISTAIVVFSAGAVSAAVLSLYRILKLSFNTRSFVRYSLGSKKSVISNRLHKISSEIGLTGRVIEFSSQDMEVFCFGFWQPKIAISSHMIESLTKPELKSVLLHEKYHLKSLEPLKLLIVKVLDRLLFFVPGYSQSINKYVLLSELSADYYSNKILQTNSHLVGALYRVISHKRSALESQLAVSYFGTLTDGRISSLSSDTKISVFPPLLVVGLVMFFTLSYGFNVLALSDNIVMLGGSQSCSTSVLQSQTSECQILIDQLAKCNLADR
jgi:Zn-dependent protease with chaperone function